MDSKNSREDEPPSKQCRVKAIGSITAFAECLEPDASSCPQALRFAHGSLCFHPDWKMMMIVGE